MRNIQISTVLLLATFYAFANNQMGSGVPMPGQYVDRESPKSALFAPGSLDPKAKQFNVPAPNPQSDTLQRSEPSELGRRMFAPGDLPKPNRDEFLNIQPNRVEEPARQMMSQDLSGTHFVSIFSDVQTLRNLAYLSGVPVTVIQNQAREMIEIGLDPNIDFRAQDWQSVKFEVNEKYILTGRMMNFAPEIVMCRRFYKK